MLVLDENINDNDLYHSNVYYRAAMPSMFAKHIFPIPAEEFIDRSSLGFILVSETSIFIMEVPWADPLPKVIFQKNMRERILDVCHVGDINGISPDDSNSYVCHIILFFGSGEIAIASLSINFGSYSKNVIPICHLRMEQRLNLMDFMDESDMQQFTNMTIFSGGDYILVWSILGSIIYINMQDYKYTLLSLTKDFLIKGIYPLENNLDDGVFLLVNLHGEHSQVLCTIKISQKLFDIRKIKEWILKVGPAVDSFTIQKVDETPNTFIIYNDSVIKLFSILSNGLFQTKSIIEPPGVKISQCILLDALDELKFKYLIVNPDQKLYIAGQDLGVDTKELINVSVKPSRIIVWPRIFPIYKQNVLFIDDFGDCSLSYFNHQSSKIKEMSRFTLGHTILDFCQADKYKKLFMTSGWNTIGSLYSGLNSFSLDTVDGFEDMNGFACHKIGANQMLVFSFVNATRVMLWHENLIDDVTPSSGIISDINTIQSGVIDDNLVQIYQNGVVVTSLEKVYGHWTTKEIITSAHISDAMIVLSLSPSLDVIALNLQNDHTFRAKKLYTHVSEVTSCSVAKKDKLTDYLILGSVDSHVTILELRTGCQLISKQHIRIAHNEVPSSLLMFHEKLYCGTRNGRVYEYHFGCLKKHSVFSFDFGWKPIKFATIDLNRFYIISDQVWLASSNEPLISSVVAYENEIEFAVCYGDNRLITICNGILSIVQTDGRPDLKRYFLPSKTPRKIAYDPVTSHLIVASTIKVNENSLQGSIDLVHPETGEILHSESLPKNEIVYSLCIWLLKENRRYICVGTHVTDSKSSKQGRLLVFNLKDNTYKSKVFYKMKLLGELTSNEPIVAIRSFLNGYLIAASGKQLTVVKIDPQDRVLVEAATYSVDAFIRSIDVFTNHILVAPQKGALALYSYRADMKVFQFEQCSYNSRSFLSCAFISKDVFCSTDRDGFVTFYRKGLYSYFETIDMLQAQDHMTSIKKISSIALHCDWVNKKDHMEKMGNFVIEELSSKSIFKESFSIVACGLLGSVISFKFLKSSISKPLLIFQQILQTFLQQQEETLYHDTPTLKAYKFPFDSHAHDYKTAKNQIQSSQNTTHVLSKILNGNLIEEFLDFDYQTQVDIVKLFIEKWKTTYPKYSDLITCEEDTWEWLLHVLLYLQRSSL